MATRRINKSFFQETKKKLPGLSMLNLFPLMIDDDNNKFINFFRSYTINNDVLNNQGFFDLTTINNVDWWENISYEYYQTVLAWWVVCMMNEVENPFEDIEPGTRTKILKQQYLYQLMREIKQTSEL